MDIEKIKVGDVIHDIRDAGALREIAGKGLSTNDYTNEDKSKLEGIEADAQKNKIESVKVNGTTVTPDSNKAVNVTVPTNMSDLNLDGGDMASGASLRFKNAGSSMVIQPFGIVKESNQSSHLISFPDKQGTVALESDIPDISGKQDTISDLSEIRSGAALGATAYQKPSAGIPVSDMTTAVQNSLELANSSVQAEPIGSIIPPVNPSQFATKDEVSQLDLKVDEKNQLLQLEELPGAIQSTTWNMRSDLTHFIIPVNGGDEIEFDNSAGTMYCAFLKSYTTPVAGATPDFCAEYVGRQSKSETLGAFSLPSDCSFLVINNPYGNWALSSLKINGVEMIQGLRGIVLGLVKAINTNISSWDGRITTNENNIIATKSSHTSVICYTSAATAKKVIANANIPQLTLDKNVRVLVTFIGSNTANDATLTLGDTVAKPLYYRGARASSTNTWQAGQTLDIRYDATNERYMAEPWDGVALVSDLQKVENDIGTEIGNIGEEIGNIESTLQDCIKPSDFSYTVTSNNIAFPDGIVENYLVADGGAILPSTSGWCMYKLPVTPGMILTVGGFYLGRNAYYAFYNGDTLVEYHGLPDPNGTTTPLTVTIPTGVTHFYFDIKSPLSPENPYEFLQINVGNSLLAYDVPTKVISEIKGEKIAGSGNSETILDLLADLPVSDGTGISTGYAYIESSTGVVKVKMS